MDVSSITTNDLESVTTDVTAPVRPNVVTGPRPDRPVVIYDGACGMCHGQVARVRRFDWLRRLDDMPFHEAAVKWPEVAAGGVGAGIRLRVSTPSEARPDGARVLVGIDAVRGIMLRTVAGFLPGLLLFLPGVHWLGDRAYRRVAARRQTGGEACALPPR